VNPCCWRRFAVAEDKETFIENTYELTDYNQTLDFNNTNLEQLLCFHEYYESLVGISAVS
jgi:hypothetical protein